MRQTSDRVLRGRSAVHGRPRRDPHTPWVLVLTAVLAVFGLWRVRQGVDHGDGAYAVALAVRLAEGAVPFVDEMSLHALGALAAVPFTWVWLQLVGLEGIVLASRIWYLVLAFAVGTVGYRALRTGFRPLPAFAAVALAGTPTAYNLLLTSYNTMPGLALGLATFAGYAALARPSGRWAAVSGAALAVSVLSHPSSLPAASVLGLLVLTLGLRRPGVVRGLLLGGGGLSLLVVLWLLLGPGLGSVLDTLAYTTADQATRTPPLQRLQDTAVRLGGAVASWQFVPALLLALVSCLPRVPGRWRAAALLAVPVAAALPGLLSTTDPGRVVVGATGGTYALLVTTALVVPVSLWAVRCAHRGLLTLLALSVPPAVVGVVSYALVTSATAHWGAVVPPAVPLLGVLGLGVVLAVSQAWGRRASLGPLVAVALLLVPLLAVHTLHSFRDPAPWIADVTITSGPHAGLSTTAARAEADCRLRHATSAWVAQGESVLAYAGPAVYLYTDARAATSILWLGTFGQANTAVVEWLDDRDAWPDVVTVANRVAADWEQHAADDPLLQRLERDYGQPVPVGPFGVIRHDGATTPPRPDPDLASCSLP